jgi:hypothetical protein
MKRSPTLALAALALAAVTTVARAQSNTAEMLQRAVRLYEDNEVEQALVILRQIISPQSPYVVSPEQRIEAYKYLGASLALQSGVAKQDSAITFFRAAIERDPFTDLDARRFSPIQLQAFGVARARTFAVSVKPVVTDTLDPRTERVRLRALSTHRARIRVELRQAGTVRRVLVDGDNDGLREIEWDGLLADGRLVPAGRYELVVIGQSLVITGSIRDSSRVFFEVRLLHAPLEDTLVALGPADLLPEQHPTSAAAGNLLRGFAAGAGAFLIGNVLASDDLDGSSGGQAIVAGVSVAAGVTTFIVRQRNRSIPENITANAQRQRARAETNAAIQARNTEKLREAQLVLAPAAGVGP